MQNVEERLQIDVYVWDKSWRSHPSLIGPTPLHNPNIVIRYVLTLWSKRTEVSLRWYKYKGHAAYDEYELAPIQQLPVKHPQ